MSVSGIKKKKKPICILTQIAEAAGSISRVRIHDIRRKFIYTFGRRSYFSEVVNLT
jgi:hypothetical protein